MPLNFERHLNNHIIPKEIHSSEDCSIETKQEEKHFPQQSRPFDKQHVINFGQNLLVRENSKIRQTFEKKKELAVFKSGNLEAITEFLGNETASPVFENEIARIKQAYETELSTATFLTEKDWKVLAAVELCDKKTFEHSIGTYLIAKNKIEKRLIKLGGELAHEGVQLEQLYRACLFHDIGKLGIPSFIFNNKATDKDWINCFMMIDDQDEKDEILVENKIIVPDSIREDSDKMLEFFSTNKLRPEKYFPIKIILSPEQIESLKKQNFDPEKSLGEIMQTHEGFSEEILKKLGYALEAFLAGNHHNYKHKSEKLGEKPVALSTLHISTEIASSIIHLADVQHALNENRSYHSKQPILRIMTFLIDDAKIGKIDPALTAEWVDDEIKIIGLQHPKYLDEIRNMQSKFQHHAFLQKSHEEILFIDEFLSDNLPDEKKDGHLAA